MSVPAVEGATHFTEIPTTPFENVPLLEDQEIVRLSPSSSVAMQVNVVSVFINTVFGFAVKLSIFGKWFCGAVGSSFLQPAKIRNRKMNIGKSDE